MAVDEFLGEAFPFHIRLTHACTIAAVGPSLARVTPALLPGTHLTEHFTLTRPYAQALSWETLRGLRGEVLTLRGANGLHLQGGVTECEGTPILLLVPVVDDLRTLSQLGLNLRDFPAHDVTGDFLLLLQTTRTSLQALRRVSSDLLKEREQLRAAQNELERSLSVARTARAAHEHSERRFRELVNTIREVIFELDADGRLTFLNPAWRSALGFDVADSLGRPLLEFIDDDDRERAREAFASAMKAQAVPLEVRIVTAAGQVRDFEIVAGPINGSGPACLAGVLNDVTTRNLALTRLEESHRTMEAAKTLAEEANEAKSNFLAAMSHEIRTPLHALLGMTELLRDTPLTAVQRELMSTVQSNAEHLRALVTDLLDLAKIEQQQLVLDEGIFEPRALIQSAAGLARSRARPGVTVRCDIAPGTPAYLRGDTTRIRQVLFNLASNAAKFTLEGSIHVEASAAPQADGRWNLHVAVTDTGIGIPDADQERIFERFQQAGNHRLVGGSGLGLHLSRALIVKMQGSIGFTSTVGRGSRFAAMIPCRIVSPDDVPVPHAGRGPSDATGTPAHVLLVEDFPASQQLAREVLTRAGHAVDIAATGTEAVTLAARTRYDIILMDLQLPDFSGFDAARRIREAEHASHGQRVPIVAVTAHASEGLAEACRLSGMDHYATKPLASDDLARLVARWTGPRPLILIIDDSDEARVISQRALEPLGYRIVQAGSGMDGLAVLDREPVDLVIVDMHMPDLSGIDVTRRIRLRPNRRNVPVLALTGDDTPDARREAGEAGCTAVLIKRAGRQVLADTVARLLDAPPSAAPGPAAGGEPEISVPEDLADLFPDYVRARQRDLETCRRGLEALAFDTVRRIAHNIKGTGTSYGMPGLTHIGRDLEHAARDQDPVRTADVLRRMEALLSRAEAMTA